ncbi:MULTISPECIES: RagB/SusD family nutrient uptake outer membrane protein [Mesonia]|uniref:SusD-like protein n=1 Tax=Mesonia oceanica TaxID=2687242 RepID=A0AC61YDE6_9FLAO|nr:MULTISPECIES: RagB/SusD family nutrient uptake outer membrane protein [Mesonia]MAN29392.1 RagB/SusD family nutrient uptake outer membrane protein [Mesonia sp.]MAQ41577.1 RagB/SusD family nutrient uptake outer membrane protein [Mesonia sp.]VVV01415.1 SusD-like protein [Mesonia oceanica]|tara:strand:+ start:1063 stop:2682 length:1620 start_codon:yes stop_codon:yes gene_type:complete
MKKIKYIATALFLGLFLSSCDDYLEEDVRSNVTGDEFYTTEEGFESLVNANYAQLKEIYGNEPWLFAAGTDMYAEGRDAEPPGLSQYTQLAPNSEGVAQLYNTCYKAIQAANTAIYYSDITENTSQLNARIGEIKFLRAHAYFLLVQTYGGVGLVNEYFVDPRLKFDRNSAEEVYSYIITEMEEALEMVEDATYGGRVNRRTIQHYLAKVFLTRAYEDFGLASDFETAAGYADAAIGGEALTLSFAELWFPDNSIKPGTIFSVQYSEGALATDPYKLGHMQTAYFGPYQGGNEFSGKAPYRTYTLCPTQYAIDLFSEDDNRWDVTFMQEVYDRYFDYFENDDTSGLPVAHYYAAAWEDTQEFQDAYMETHPNAVYHPYGSYVPSINPNNDYQTIPVKKFDDPSAQFGQSTSTRDIILARLAETYLIAAEAYLQAGETTTGLQRLNEVRQRAGVSDASLAEFDIDYILDERGRELLGEYHRWFDLKRTGKLVERASMYHYLIEESNFNGANGALKILRPIPQEVLDLNQNNEFPQNPAYQ